MKSLGKIAPHNANPPRMTPTSRMQRKAAKRNWLLARALVLPTVVIGSFWFRLLGFRVAGLGFRVASLGFRV